MLEVTEIFDVLNILTTPKQQGAPNTEHKETTENQQRNVFNVILEERLDAFKKIICEERYDKFRQEFLKKKYCHEDKKETVHWNYALTCLKVLDLLETSLNHRLREFKESQQSQNQKELKPSQAPPLSPDALSIGQQKTVLTTMQFVSMLGISPALQKGVGIPIEMKSEFGRMIAMSETDIEFSDFDRHIHLIICLKVLMKCIKCPSLGALILSRNLNDLLAVLLQLLYGSHRSDKLTDSETPKIDNSERMCCSEGLENWKKLNTSTNCSQISVTAPGASKLMIPNRDCDGSVDVRTPDLPSNWTPASIVDLQIQKQKQVLSSESEINVTDKETLDEMFVREHLSFLEESLQELLTRVYQPMIVRELLLLQGGPQQVLTKEKTSVNMTTRKVVLRAPVWLRKSCSKLLTDILIKPKGVINVLKGMLDGVPGSDTPGEIKESVMSDWRKCDAVARVISFCPVKALSLEEYYKMVSPQVLELINYPDKRVAHQFLRVGCTSVSYMMSQNAELTKKYLICPLLQPLLSYINTQDADSKQSDLVKEPDLSTCIENIHKVFVSGIDPDSPAIKCLRPVCTSIFMLYCFIYSSASHLKSLCHDIVVKYLKHSDKKDSVMCLKTWILPAHDELGSNMFPRMHPGFRFAYSNNGGVTIVNNLSPENDLEQEHLGEPKTVVVDVMLIILVDLQKEGLVGDFFLAMLEALMDIVTKETTGSMREELTDLGARKTCTLSTIQSHINILHLLAAICEKIGPSCVEDKKQTLRFVKVTLERAVFVYSNAGDEVTTIFESETLTMALGLLTAILGGGLQLTEEDREDMKELLPLLQDLSDNHPDPFIQEMSSDLRIAIATYGAVVSEILKKPVNSFSDKTVQNVEQHANEKSRGQANEKFKQQKIKEKPLIEEIHQDTGELHSKTKDKKAKDNYEKSDVGKMSVIQTYSENNDDGREPEFQKVSENDDGNVSEIQKAFTELCDPMIPVRGHALITLAKLIQDKHPHALDKKDLLLKIFLENLSHIDSYLYLASINGLTGLADIYPDIVIKKLVQEFLKSTPGDRKNGNVETRLKIGECLVKATRNLGDMVPKYRNILLAAYLNGARDQDGFVRASSISNLGEICKLLRFSLGSVLHEIFDCCSSLLKSDTEVKVREAAAMMIYLLLQGLDKDIIKVLDSVIKDLYKLLKYSLTVEGEDSVKLHVTLALNELDTIMRELLFPQQKLQKRIKVLDPD